MNVDLLILEATGASKILRKEHVQTLWSGYGSIIRYHLENGAIPSVILKHIAPPNSVDHPRGWSTNISHERKLKSYQVESEWYKNWANKVTARIPKFLCYKTLENNSYILLEDLNASGYSLRKSTIDINEIYACLDWLATFHAQFIGTEPEQLWEKGTYWHLDTRPEELEMLEDLSLKEAASKIDEILHQTKYKTIVHGDAKLANFCFAADGGVAAVDFQYVGGGCGMKDVVYFIGSCLSEKECEKMAFDLRDYYLDILKDKLELDCAARADLLNEWSQLFAFAWADFHRFLKGWSPDHWKINSFSERITKMVIDSL